MSDCAIGYNGERPDPVGGVHHLGLGHRAYSPALMRFHCPDSLSPFGAGGVNPYAYCDGDPINRADPSGQFSVGGAIGIGLGALGVLLTPVSFGTTLAAALSIGAVVAGVASVGLGIAAEVVDDRKAAEILGWSSLALGIVSCGVALGVSRLVPKAATLIGVADLKLGAWLQGRGRLLARIERGERGGFGVALGGRLTRCFRPAAEPVEELVEMSAPRRSSLSSGMDAFLALSRRQRQDRLIGAGTQGTVYDVGERWVVKEPLLGVRTARDIFALQNEAYVFRQVYGAESAVVRHDRLWMLKIRGRPVSSLDLSPYETWELERKIAAEQRRLADMGIFHDDLSGDNVLLTDEGEVKFIDFGRATYLQRVYRN
ncbi:RHS repeat-associated core domain-containing protein [Chromobacterium vaccinii]|uniref:RHS repeat-associated core domain-containing protein n=1 Tax=Chromobacterium TaxID=535 RepID=UPI0018F24AF3|nr:RHS repeat-associated core domain-containing protein [Chromobacterium sp. ATCC 53434]